MPFGQFQVDHKNMARRLTAGFLEKRADSSTCPNFYLAPTIGQIVNSLDPLTITWNTTCLSAQAIDIYLYSSGAQLPRIHVWENIALSRGTYNATLMPRWWNSTSSQRLQISIVTAGQPPFLAAFPAGPVFNATYSTPASGTPSSADVNQVSSGITQVNDLANTKNAVSPGKKAAAVLLTLLFVGFCIAAYIRFKRNKGKQERKRWTEAVDKRMSTISSDWKSVSVAGANAAIRSSIAIGNRSSSFSFGGIRPSSTLAVEGDDEKRPVSQMRTGVGLRNPITPVSTERVSRVSFAPDTRISRASVADSRPSGESRRTRAFHTGFVPPVPSLPDTDAVDDSDSGSISPRQSQGPLTLTPDDIRAKIAANKRSRSTTPNGMNEMDEVMPALRMMRTGGDASAPDDLLLRIPSPPIPAHPNHVMTSVSPAAPQHMTSPVMSTIPMEPMPANVMSPDEMLRAYAERKRSMSTSKPVPSSFSSIISYPKALVKKASMRSSHRESGSNTMRALYNANTGSLSPTDTSDDHYSAYGGATHGQPSESSILEENHETENVAGMGVGFGHSDLHPFGYHPYAYGGANYAIGDNTGRGTEVGALYIAQ